MRVLFVYPKFPVTYWSFKHALAIEGKSASFPPLGLLTVAAMLPPLWEKRLADLNTESLKTSDLEWADIVFLSAMIVQKESVSAVIEECAKLKKRVVAGGPFVSAFSDDFSQIGAETVFVGEVEETLPQFIHDIECGEPRKLYRSDRKPDLALTPVPDFSLINLSKYGAMCVQYSRGCPFQCEFCDIIEIYGRVPRTKSAEKMLAELDALRLAGWRGLVFIVDDNFIGNKRSVRKFLPELVEWGKRHDFPFTFITEASVNLAEDENLLGLMEEAHFSRVFLGIETPFEESLKEIHKGQNTKRDLLGSVAKIQSYGMEVMAGFIVGFDSDPADIFEIQISFIRASGIPLAMVGLLNALPETRLWKRLKSEGRLLQGSSGNNTDCSLNFVPKMDGERLIEGYREILTTIYSPQEFYKRANDCLRRMTRERVDIQFGGLWNRILAFSRLVLTLGVFDRERIEFWRYVRDVLQKHRKRFAYAMVLAAMGYHFRLLTENFRTEL